MDARGGRFARRSPVRARVDVPRIDRVGAIRRALSSLAMLAAGGCSAVVTVDPDGTRTAHHFGYVRVVLPDVAAPHPVRAWDVTTFGLVVGEGFSLGYARDRKVVVPEGCRVVVMVANPAQLDHAVRRLQETVSRGDLCVAVHPAIE